MPDENYRARIAIEREKYQDNLNVHALPQIFHYWSNTYVRPKVEALGIGSGSEMFHQYLEGQCKRRKNGTTLFVSIGSGNCDLEIELALRLRAKGYTEFVIECLDLNANMLERGCLAAAKEGLGEHLDFVQADVNEWSPAHEYEAVIANQALHHVLQLEKLFTQIKSSLQPDGCFIISDIIGRNGHQRWPEALPIVREFWRKLPPSYRYNRQLQRYEQMFEDWDCSIESFEGIRSQDILPLLLDQFCFHMFFGFANVIDPFVDRSFGPNFDATAEWDRAFIDEVNRRDEEEILSGRIKPTHMLAVVGKKPASHLLFQEPLSPEFCVRPPTMYSNATTEPAAEVLCPLDAHQLDAWPHAPQRELVIVCGWLSNAEDVIKHLRNEFIRVDQLSQERTAWALQLDMEVEQLNLQLEQRTAWAQRLDKEVQELSALVEERTGWAQRVDKELEQSDALAQQLARALEERTALALKLDQKLKSLDWALRVDQFLRKLFRSRS